MKKVFPLLSLSLISLTLTLGTFSRVSTQKAEAMKEVVADIYNVQMRSGGDGLSFLVIADHSIYMNSASSYSDVSSFNAPDYINVYLTPTGAPIKLSSIIDDGIWWCNLWDSEGIMFPIADYETYNGLSVFAIEILEGCTYPNTKYEKVVVPATKKYTNDHYLYDGDDKEDVKNLSFTWTEVKRDVETTISLNGAQVRGQRGEDDEHDLLYIDILSPAYDATSLLLYPNTKMSLINVYDYINIYTSKNGTPKKLSDIAKTYKEGVQNQFSAVNNVPAFFIRLSTAEYATYNALTIYMIEVLQGCEVLVDNTICTIDKDYRFVNGDFGTTFPDTDEGRQAKAIAELNGFNFGVAVTTDDLVNFGKVTMQNIHNRMDRHTENRWLIFLFNENIYTTSTSVKHFIDEINFLDKIWIYKSEDDAPKKLREYYDSNITGQFVGITIAQFGVTNSLGISILNPKDSDGAYINDGGHMYQMVIEAGTQIPSIENGQLGYRVVQNKILIMNDEYGKFGRLPAARPDSNDDDKKHRRRTYEDWNINWTIVPCFVTFTVEGIEDLKFDDMFLNIGQRVSLQIFAQDGYKLTAVTKEGDKIYRCIIGVNRTVNVILKYTPQ